MMNKPRLIDANELVEVVKNVQNHMKEVNKKPVPVDAREIFALFVEMIDFQPTAYDMDKVVERLEEAQKNPNLYVYAWDAYEEAIEIVKGGAE